MSNVYNIGLVSYKTVKVASLDSITQIVFSHTKRPQCLIKVTRSRCLSDYRWRCCTVLIKLKDKEKGSVSCGHRAHVKFLRFSSKIRHILFLSLTTFSAVDACNPSILL
jgi:hypothetical protein